MKSPSGDQAINLDAQSSAELKRSVTSQKELDVHDSSVIPNIEEWLKGRCETPSREILKNQFGDSSFQ